MTVIALDLWPFEWATATVGDRSNDNVALRTGTEDRDEHGVIHDVVRCVTIPLTYHKKMY